MTSFNSSAMMLFLAFVALATFVAGIPVQARAPEDDIYCLGSPFCANKEGAHSHPVLHTPFPTSTPASIERRAPEDDLHCDAEPFCFTKSKFNHLPSLTLPSVSKPTLAPSKDRRSDDIFSDNWSILHYGRPIFTPVTYEGHHTLTRPTHPLRPIRPTGDVVGNVDNKRGHPSRPPLSVHEGHHAPPRPTHVLPPTSDLVGLLNNGKRAEASTTVAPFGRSSSDSFLDQAPVSALTDGEPVDVFTENGQVIYLTGPDVFHNSVWHTSTKAGSQTATTSAQASPTSKSFTFATPTLPAKSTSSCTEESKSTSTRKPALPNHFSHSFHHPYGTATRVVTMANGDKTTLTYHEPKPTSSQEPKSVSAPVQNWPWVLETTTITDFSHAAHKSTMTWFSHLPTPSASIPHPSVTNPLTKRSDFEGKPVTDWPRPTTTHAKCTTTLFQGKPFVFGPTSTKYAVTATHTSYVPCGGCALEILDRFGGGPVVRYTTTVTVAETKTVYVVKCSPQPGSN